MDKRLNKINRCFEVVRDVRTDMPIQQAAILVKIAMHEGITLAKLAESLGTTGASITRNTKQLSTFAGQNRESKGFGFVSMAPSFDNRRELACFLTDKGKEFIEELAKTME